MGAGPSKAERDAQLEYRRKKKAKGERERKQRIAAARATVAARREKEAKEKREREKRIAAAKKKKADAIAKKLAREGALTSKGRQIKRCDAFGFMTGLTNNVGVSGSVENGATELIFVKHDTGGYTKFVSVPSTEWGKPNPINTTSKEINSIIDLNNDSLIISTFKNATNSGTKYSMKNIYWNNFNRCRNITIPSKNQTTVTKPKRTLDPTPVCENMGYSYHKADKKCKWGMGADDLDNINDDCKACCKFYNVNNSDKHECIEWERMEDSAAENFLLYYKNISKTNKGEYNIENYKRPKKIQQVVKILDNNTFVGVPSSSDVGPPLSDLKHKQKVEIIPLWQKPKTHCEAAGTYGISEVSSNGQPLQGKLRLLPLKNKGNVQIRKTDFSKNINTSCFIQRNEGNFSKAMTGCFDKDPIQVPKAYKKQDYWPDDNLLNIYKQSLSFAPSCKNYRNDQAAAYPDYIAEKNYQEFEESRLKYDTMNRVKNINTLYKTVLDNQKKHISQFKQCYPKYENIPEFIE